MFSGKLTAATRLIDSANRAGGVHPVNEQVIAALQAKHPPAEPIKAEALITDAASRELPDPVIYEGIDGVEIFQAAKSTFGSGGPTRIDSDIWQQLLCSNVHKKESESLCHAVSNVAKHLCRNISHPEELPAK